MATRVRNPALAGQTCRNEHDGVEIVHRYDAAGEATIEIHEFALLLERTCGHTIVETDWTPTPNADVDPLTLAEAALAVATGVDWDTEALANTIMKIGGNDAVARIVGGALGVARERHNAATAMADAHARVERLEGLAETAIAAAQKAQADLATVTAERDSARSALATASKAPEPTPITNEELLELQGLSLEPAPTPGKADKPKVDKADKPSRRNG